MRAHRSLPYRRKLALVFLLVSVIPASAFYAFFLKSAFTSRRNEILQNAEISLAASADRLSGLIALNEQRLDVFHRNYLIQNYLRANQPVPFSIELYEFFYTLNTLYNATKETDAHWKLTVYCFNEHPMLGSFLEPPERMDPVLREAALAQAPDVLFRSYGPPGTSGGESLYLLRRLAARDAVTVAVEAVRIGFNRVRACFAAGFPEGTAIEYRISGAQTGIPLAAASLDPEDAYRLSTRLENGDEIAVLVPKATVWNAQRGNLLLLIVGYVLLIVLFLTLVYFISRTLSQRLDRLLVDIDQDLPALIHSGTFRAAREDDEFGRIQQKIGELAQEIGKHYQERAQMQAEKKALELELLQSLINPHFLYNTLAGIKWTFTDPRLSIVVDSLVRYYRIALNRGNAILEIRQEMEMIRSYLSIQRFAYESEFQFDIAIEEGIAHLPILKNLIQPVVENAVLHGIKKQSPGDRIDITGVRQGEEILFVVADNGVGMAPEKSERILQGALRGVQSGYGLYNIQRRIQLYYGDDCGLRIESTRGTGTRVFIRIRARAPDAQGGSSSFAV